MVIETTTTKTTTTTTIYRVVEELLQLFVGVVDAQLLEAVELEDLKASDVEDANEAGTLSLGAVQGPVDPGHDPLEEAFVHRFADGLDGEFDLFLKRESKHLRDCFICNYIITIS